MGNVTMTPRTRGLPPIMLLLAATILLVGAVPKPRC
jgi:hypothetical protein